MKKGMITFLAILWTFSLANAQTVTLTFTGRDASSQHVQLHRVCVTNLTRGWQETIYWPDTTLSMQNSTGISENGLGEGFSLAQNVPNPFSGETEVIMVTDATGEVFLTASDVTGKSVAVFSRMLEPGGHHFRIRLADAQTYILTAWQGARSASVKMVNKGTSKGNEILYEGSGNPISYTLKSSTTHPFTFGDQMEYVGYAVINGSEEESQRITQAQGASQTFVMQFQGEQDRMPTVVTSAVTDLAAIALYGSCAVDEFSAVCGGSVTEEGTTPVLERGVCWGTSHNPTIADNHTVDGNGIGVFNSSITGLVPGLTYYVRAYATNNTGTAYGTEESFVTTGSLPCMTNDYVSNPFSTCVEFSAHVYDEGSSSVLERGVCWSTSPNPTIADNHISNGVGSGYFNCSISGLNPHTTYYMCAYAINNLGISYSEEEEIVTGGNPQPNLGAIHSSEVIDLTTIQVSVGDFHWNMCVDSIIDKGVCWDTTQFSSYYSYCDLTLADSHMSAGSGNAGFIINITNVMPNVWYCFSVYVITASGDTIYWHNVLQKRKIHINLPSVTTLNNASNITDTSAISGGNVTWGGSNQFPEAVTSRGVCWSTSHNPTIADSHTSDGSGTGSFTSSITGLAPGTTYYVRAYATNSIGTAYGNEVMFTTASPIILPSVTTLPVSTITDYAASCGGNVISDGGATVTVRGVCWSTSHNPTIAENHTTDGTGTGNFISNITGLSASTTYYVRAYAINSVGVAYGEEVIFTTATISQNHSCPGAPTVTDYDGNVYNTVQIGNQCWMKENLRTTHYSNGIIIPLGFPFGSSSAKNRNYPNDDSTLVNTYGYLYTWHAAMNGSGQSNSNPSGVQGACPTGWHIPSKSEWEQLLEYVQNHPQYWCHNDSNYIAKALASTDGWGVDSSEVILCGPSEQSYNNNTTGFSALPAGFGGYNTEASETSFIYSYLAGCYGIQAIYWSSTTYAGVLVEGIKLQSFSGYVELNSGLTPIFLYSVRCLRD